MSSTSPADKRDDQAAGKKPVQDADWFAASLLMFVPTFFLKSSLGVVASTVWTAIGAAGLLLWAFLMLRIRRTGTASKIWPAIVTLGALTLVVRIVMAWR